MGTLPSSKASSTSSEAPAAPRSQTSFDVAFDADDEARRLRALHRYDILDAELEDIYDRIANLAAHLFDAPIAAVSLIDEDRQWFKSCIGVQDEGSELETSFCARAIQSPGVLVVEDAQTAEPFSDMRMVTGEPGIRFYAGAPLTTPDGHRLGALCVIDTTPRPRPDEELLEHLQSLAQVVVNQFELRRETAERKARAQELRQVAQRAEVARATARNAQKAAEEARKQAEAASESKSRFLSGIAHDLRSPIASIRGFAEVLNHTLQPPHATHAEKILAAADHLGEMADTLSKLSNLESGQVELSTETADLRTFLREASDSLDERARSRQIDLQVFVPDAPVRVQVNPGALRRVVDNLATNAVKYCGAGDRVTLRLHPEPVGQPPGDAGAQDQKEAMKASRDASSGDASSGDASSGDASSGDASSGDASARPAKRPSMMCFEVSDTGPGISNDFIDVMYEPFTQVSGTKDGSGLGLAITKELIDVMGGYIEASSEPDGGTTFAVFLRAAS